MAARQLPPHRRGDPGRPARPAAAVLPGTAQARLAGDGRYRARLRDGPGADPPHRRAPGPAAARALRGGLPDGGAPHDRRAVGVAQHAEARPHREPEAAGRRNARRPGRAAQGRRVSRPDRRHAGRRAPAVPAQNAGDALCRAPPAADARVRTAGLARPRRGGATSRHAGHHRRGRDPLGAPAAGCRAGVRRQRHHEPAAVRHPGLDAVLRDRQPDRAGPAARPGRRLPENGLPQPGSLPAGGRGAGRADR